MNVDSTRVPEHERGAADHDEPYTWGLSPSMYLAPRQIARMMVLRCRLDNRQSLRNRTNWLPRHDVVR
jgi:hypothetical protein